MPKARSGFRLCAGGDELTSVAKARSASLVVFVWCFVCIGEQCDREGTEDVAQDYCVVNTLEGNLRLIVKDGKPSFGRLLGQDNPRLFTGTYGDEPTVRPEKSGGEARHNDQAPVAAETASKRNHTVLIESFDMHRKVVAFQ